PVSVVLSMMFTATLCSACSGAKVIPPELAEQIDKSASFSEILASPQSYQGRTILLGGEVLASKRMQDGVELEMLQLPVRDDDDPPVDGRSESRGRFIAFDRGGGDPASFPPGTRLTLVGTVSGDDTRRLDESTDHYTTGDVKHMYILSEDSYRDRSRNSVGLFGGVGFGFGGGGGRSGSF